MRTWLIEKRKAKYRTQQELADAMHVTRGTVHNWEAGKNLPNKSQMARLCDLLKVSPKRFYE